MIYFQGLILNCTLIIKFCYFSFKDYFVLLALVVLFLVNITLRNVNSCSWVPALSGLCVTFLAEMLYIHSKHVKSRYQYLGIPFLFSFLSPFCKTQDGFAQLESVSLTVLHVRSQANKHLLY